MRDQRDPSKGECRQVSRLHGQECASKDKHDVLFEASDRGTNHVDLVCNACEEAIEHSLSKSVPALLVMVEHDENDKCQHTLKISGLVGLDRTVRLALVDNKRDNEPCKSIDVGVGKVMDARGYHLLLPRSNGTVDTNAQEEERLLLCRKNALMIQLLDKRHGGLLCHSWGPLQMNPLLKDILQLVLFGCRRGQRQNSVRLCDLQLGRNRLPKLKVRILRQKLCERFE